MSDTGLRPARHRRGLLRRLREWFTGPLLAEVGEPEPQPEEEWEWEPPWDRHDEVLRTFARISNEARELAGAPVNAGTIVHHVNRWLEAHEVHDLLAADDWSAFVAWTSAEALVSVLAGGGNIVVPYATRTILAALMREAKLSPEQAKRALWVMSQAIWAAATPLITYAARHRVDKDIPFPYGEPVPLVDLPPLVTTEEVDS